MGDQNIEEQEFRFCAMWQGLNRIYEDYARSKSISYTSLHILVLIERVENCTQKFICEQTFLPKQTVNSVITSFYNDGYVELHELPTDRRTKVIKLTESGKAYADKLISHIRQAEYEAMETLSAEQRKALLEGIQIYCNAFKSKMLEK